MTTVRHPLKSLEAIVARHSEEYARLVGPAEFGKPANWIDPYQREEWEHELHVALSSDMASYEVESRKYEEHLRQYRYMDDRLRQQGVFSLRRSLAAAYDEYARFRSFDCFVVSYPKCGRTWMRHLIGSYLLCEGQMWSHLQVEDISLNSGNLRGITITHDDDPHLKHFSLVAQSKAHFENKRVVLLVRNPLDAIVSFFYQFHLRGGRDLLGSPNAEVSIEEFLAFEFGGIPNIVAFLNAWGEYIDSGGDVKIVSYEALHQDAPAVLSSVLSHFGRDPVNFEQARNASLRSTFSAMRRSESEGIFADPRLLPGDILNYDTYKTRRGRIGGYVDVLPQTTIDWAMAYIAKHLRYPHILQYTGAR